MEFYGILWKFMEGYGISWNFMEGTCPRHAWNHFSFFFFALTVLYESISLLTQSNPIKKAPMKTCSWKLCSWQFLLQTHIFKEVGNRIFLTANSLQFACNIQFCFRCLTIKVAKHFQKFKLWS